MIELIANLITIVIFLVICASPFIIGGISIFFLIKYFSKKKQNRKGNSVKNRIQEVKIPTSVKKKVYLIEDEESAFELFRDALSKEYIVNGALDPVVALEELKGVHYNLILSGMILPNMAGIEILDRLNNNSNYSFDNFVFLTNIAGDIAKNKAFEMGADGYLIKSETSIEDLISYVNKIFNGINSSQGDKGIIHATQNKPKFNFGSINSYISSFKPKENQKNWVKLLNIPYRRWILNIPQCEEEIIKLFNDLANFIDRYLHKNGSSLLNLKQKLDASGGYYSDILYTIECIAEGEIERHYKNGEGYDNSFSFKLLSEHIDNHVVTELQNYIKTRIDDVSKPNKHTIEKLGLTPNGLPYVWWDKDGKLREKLDLDENSGKWLQRMKYRSTKFLEIEQCRIETVKLYLEVIKYLDQLKKSNDIEDKGNNYLRGLFTEKYYKESHAKFLKDIFKLSENKVRGVYPNTKQLNCTKEESRIKRIVGSQLFEKLIIKLGEIGNEIPTPTKETIIKLRKSTPISSTTFLREVKKDIDQNNYLDQFKKIRDFINTTDSNKLSNNFYLNLCEIFSNVNIVLSLFFLHKYNSHNQKPKKLKATIQKKIFRSEDIYEGFTELSVKVMSDKDLISSIKKLFIPKRKKVDIDVSKIKLIREKHEKTVDKLTSYLNDELEDDIDDYEADKKEVMTETLEDIFESSDLTEKGNIIFNELQRELVQLIYINGGVCSAQEVENYAIKNNQFLNSFIDEINQKFYDKYEETLIYKDKDNYYIEKEFNLIIKELLNENKK